MSSAILRTATAGAAGVRAPRAAFLPALIGVALVVTVLVIQLAPPRVGGFAYRFTAAVFAAAMLVGPIARGARPRRVWVPEAVGSACFLVSVFHWLVPLTVGPLRFYDLCFAVGYTAFFWWIVQLYRHVGGRPRNRTPLLDTLTVPLAVGLGLWTVALSPLVGGAGLPAGLVEMMYPTADAVLLTMLVHLAWRKPVVPVSHRWLIAALGVQFVFDVAYAVNVVVLHGTSLPWAQVWFLLTYAALAVVATHPSVVEMSHPVVGDAHEPTGRRGTGFVVLMMSTAVLAVAVPPRGLHDTVVRTVLVVVLLGMLFVRLSTTMRDLYRAEADSSRRALRDPLTGLLNRTALFDALAARLRLDVAGLDTRAVDEPAEPESTEVVALLYLDCDDFKYVNDTWGHHAGDRLLCDVAARITARLDDSDVLARYGGDEFVAVTAVADVQEGVAVAERIRRAFDDPIRVLPTRLHAVTPSIGIAVAVPGDGTTPEELLRRADSAMYAAKSRGRGHYVIFEERFAQRSLTRAAVGDRLGDAVRAGAFRVHLQPIMGGPGYATLLGWEALARWNDPVLGDVPPDVFIEVAEQHGYIADLGAFVLRRACIDLSDLHTALGRTDLTVSVNVSAAQLIEADFADIVFAARCDAGLAADALRLEVTETHLLQDGPVVAANLRRLSEGGVHIGVDDFGTGYASLASLLRLPVDSVKLDRSLVARLDGDDANTRILAAVVDFLRHLGIDDIVAEGVETTEQEAALRTIGCPKVQGWLYGRPASPADIAAAHAGSSPSGGRLPG